MKYFFAAVVLSAVTCVTVAAPATADNKQTWRSISLTGSGFRGEQHIRTDPVVSSGDPGLVHPVQAYFNTGGQFLAMGTYKGQGAGNGGCPNDYDPKWNVYTDGDALGMYFCAGQYYDVYDETASPSFRIVRDDADCSGKTCVGNSTSTGI